jgi:hypothetical protein
VLDQQDLCDTLRGQIASEARETFPDHQRAYRTRRISRDLLRGR